eukprot:gene5713-biopygen2325
MEGVTARMGGCYRTDGLEGGCSRRVFDAVANVAANQPENARRFREAVWGRTREYAAIVVPTVCIPTI